jgi:hypothetical protein
MQPMSQQRRDAIRTLDETTSPFSDSHSQHIFKNTANLQLRGNTFDAKHLDNFLDSVYGERAIYVNSRKAIKGPEDSIEKSRSLTQNLPSYMVSTSGIKPTTSFLSQERDKIQFQDYVDLYSGPSSLQKRPEYPTQYE